MMYTMAEMLFILCVAGTCVKSGDVVQIPVPPAIVSYTRSIEFYPKLRHEGVLYILVPESAI